MDFINDNKHLRLSGNLLRSRYYNYVLTPVDCRIFSALWNSILAPKGPYYKKGLLVVNIKQETIANYTGVSKPTVMRSIKKLNKLGVVIVIRQKQNNNRYLLGFRSKGNEWLLFIYHLVNKYEALLSERVDEQIEEGNFPDIGNPEMYKMSDYIKEYMVSQFNSNYFFTTKVNEEETITEILFNRKDYFYTPELFVVSAK